MKKMSPLLYKMILRDISEGHAEAFEVYVPALDAHCFGDTPVEALEAYYAYFKSESKRRKKEGIKMPASDVVKEKVKQVPLRLPEPIYEKAVSRARSQGLSFNAFVTERLASI